MAAIFRKRLLPLRTVRRSGLTSLSWMFTACLVGTCFLYPAWMARAEASQAPESDSGVKVNVGIAAAKPGDPIDIPITLSGTENVQVGSIASRISFPKATLSYTEVEMGLAVDLAEGEAKGVIQEDKDDSSQSILEITLSAKNPIKPGILAYLKFRVSTDAQKGVIPLKVKDTKATAAGGGPMQLAKGDDGEITIFALDEQIPVVGCFFFTH